MCGVAYLYGSEMSAAERGNRIQCALKKMNHRGPDGSGIHQGANFAVGHLRLAIVDLVGGKQPVSDPSGRYTLIFNGEIYNFKALREALAGRWDFRDASDTEVLLAGLVVEGESFVAKLDGMWAFVLHDAAAETWLLSRDRFGKKPLYYVARGESFACASELPALQILLPEAGWSESVDDITDYFCYGYPMPGRTCIQGVQEVLPGHFMRCTPRARSEHRYWVPDTTPWQGTFQEAADIVRQLLTAAVIKRQLAADVEVGAFLSGGVDSTVVCALAQSSGFGQLKTFTAGFAEPTYDERSYAAQAAREIGTQHYSEELLPSTASKLAEKIPMLIGQPFGDASLVPTAMVSAVASRHVKVVLTGDGGDEVFGGYARYSGRLVRRRYRRVPSILRTTLERMVLATPEPAAHHSGSLLKKAHLFVGLAREPNRTYIAPPAIRADILEQLAPGLPPSLFVPQLHWGTDLEELKHMMLMDWLVWLPQDILVKVDRATMASSVEARSPFLDKDLVEFVMRLPWQWHFSGFRGKRLLRAAMRDLAPKFVWSRRKQGFASPLSYWMRGRLGDELAAMVSDASESMIDHSVVRRLLVEHKQGGADHAQPLWLVYAYLRWRESMRRERYA